MSKDLLNEYDRLTDLRRAARERTTVTKVAYDAALFEQEIIEKPWSGDEPPPASEQPTVCPKCKSPYWNRPRQIKPEPTGSA